MVAHSIQLTLHGLSNHISSMTWDGTAGKTPIIHLNNGQSYTITVPDHTPESLRCMTRDNWIEIAKKVDEVLTKVNIWDADSYQPANKIYDLTIDKDGVNWQDRKVAHAEPQKETFSVMLKIVNDALQTAATAPSPQETDLKARYLSLNSKVSTRIAEHVKDKAKQVEKLAFTDDWIAQRSNELKENRDVKALTDELLTYAIQQQVKSVVEETLTQLVRGVAQTHLKDGVTEAASVSKTVPAISGKITAVTTISPAIKAHMQALFADDVWTAKIIHAEYAKAQCLSLTDRVTKFFGEMMNKNITDITLPSLNFKMPSFSSLSTHFLGIQARMTGVLQLLKS